MENKIEIGHQIIGEVFKIKDSLNTILNLLGYSDAELKIGLSEKEKIIEILNSFYESKDYPKFENITPIEES